MEIATSLPQYMQYNQVCSCSSLCVDRWPDVCLGAFASLSIRCERIISATFPRKARKSALQGIILWYLGQARAWSSTGKDSCSTVCLARWVSYRGREELSCCPWARCSCAFFLPNTRAIANCFSYWGHVECCLVAMYEWYHHIWNASKLFHVQWRTF